MLNYSRITLGFIALVLVSVAVPIAASAQSQGDGFIGRVEGTSALIAVVVDGAQVTAYVCDGDAIVGWVRGTRTGNTSLLQGPDAPTVVLASTSGSPWGAVYANGRAYGFTTEPPSGHAGLFRAEGTTGTSTFSGAWIVAPSGDVRGTAVVQNIQNGSTITIRDGSSNTAVESGPASTQNFQALQVNLPGIGNVPIQQIVSPRDPASIVSPRDPGSVR